MSEFVVDQMYAALVAIVLYLAAFGAGRERPVVGALALARNGIRS